MADPTGEFAEKLDLTFEKSLDIFGTVRNKRYAIVVENGKVSKVVSEPDNVGVKGMSWARTSILEPSTAI